MKTKSKISTKAKPKPKPKGSTKVKSKSITKSKSNDNINPEKKIKSKKKLTVSPKEKIEIKWLNTPEEHDYPASLSYLRLIYKDDIAEKIIADIRKAPISKFKAKDIFRASSLSLLGVSNFHVKKDRKKIKNGVSISPIILVRDTNNGKVVIADGYHRLCAVYTFSEDILIPCQII